MNDWQVLENIDLKKYNTYGIGGKAKALITPKTFDELINIINYHEEKNIPYQVLGSGSNVILPDGDFDGSIIKLDNFNEFSFQDNIVYLGSGLQLTNACKKLIDMGYTNLVPLYGIPGTIGGAIVGNAGANGKSIFDDVIDVIVLYKNKIITLRKSDIKYSYRTTEFKNNKDYIILGVHVSVTKGNQDKAWEEINNNMLKRKNSQPLEYKNAGSVFKNPDGKSAGKLIEESGLKGLKVNDAMVSLKHANFIINLGNATSHDIIKLIDIVREEVKKDTNIELELEQVIIKW